MSKKWPDWNINPNWALAWRVLGAWVIGSLAISGGVFLSLEWIGWKEIWPGISTLSDWMVATHGPEGIAHSMTAVGLVIIIAGVVWILIWNWHAWQVWTDQQKRTAIWFDEATKAFEKSKSK